MRLHVSSLHAVVTVLIPLLSACTDVLDAGDAPRVTAIEPGDLATDVPRGTTITATFTKPIAASAAGTGTFKLTYQPSGYAIAHVDGTLTVQGTRVTFTPSSEPSVGLRSGMRYRVVVDGFKDLAGRVQSHPFLSTFIVVSSPPPTVVSTSPAGGAMDVATSQVVTVTFSEAIDPASVTELSFQVRGGGSNDPIAGTRTVQGSSITFTPSTPLVPGESYGASVAPGITDLDGASLTYDYSWFFSTARQ